MLPAIAAPSGCPIVPQRSGRSGVSGVIVGPHRAGQGAPPPAMMRSAPSRSDAALSPLRCLVRRMYRYAVLASFGTDPQSRCTSIKYQLKSLYFLFAMLQPTPAAFLRDPVTVPRAERIEHYRAQADRYRQLAECDGPASVREGLVELARQCDAMAEALRQRGQRQ